MRPIGFEDILGRERYGAERDAIRRRIIAHKRARRVAVGDRLSFLFEDQATIWYQTQEMLWIEHITDLDAIREELAVYNALLPGPGALSATLLIEIEDQSRLREEINRLIGIDEHVTLEVGGELGIAAAFEAGRQTAEKLSAVQYVTFPLAAEARRRIAAGSPLALTVAHPNYRARAPLPEAVRASLAADLADPAAAEEALRRVRDGG
ncbi:MAG: DUF3501 family protein [Deltaproteobacteria bacterium]|nr:MAG: DUF3501 family protein [Deltaproteobacteria bacterium]